MKNCDDEVSADALVQNCQKLCDTAYEKDTDLTEEQEEQFKGQVKQALLYRVGKIDGAICERKFDRQGMETGEKLYNQKKIWITVVLFLGFSTQVALTTLDYMFEKKLYTNMPLQEILDHRNKIDFPLLAVQFMLGVFNIIQILSVIKFQQAVSRQDDPFLNGHLICIQIFLVTVQRIIFTCFLGTSIDVGEGDQVANPEDAYHIVSVARYACMSMEFLFIVVPLRHNFEYHNIEL